MSPQKKPAAKPVVQKGAKIISGAARVKKLERTPSGSLKKTPQKLSTPAKKRIATEDLTDAIGAGVYLEQKGKYISASVIYEKLTGYPAADLLGKSFLAHIHPDDRKAVVAGHKKQCRDPYEYRLIRKDGEIIWLLETAGPINSRKAKAILGSVMDITRYKQDEESRRLKEERYGSLLQDIVEDYYEEDLGGNFTFVNDAMARHTGYSIDELIGMNYRQYCDAGTAEKLQKLYTQVYETGKPFAGVEVPVIIKNGQSRCVELSAALIRDGRGKPIGFRGTARDITGHKAIEENLRKSEERYRTILEEIEEGFYELDLDGRITFINEPGAKLIGSTPREVIGMNFREYADLTLADNLVDVFKDIYKTGKGARRVEEEFVCRDGIRRCVEISGTLMRDDTGKPIGFRGLLHDITQRKWTEEALLQSEAKYFSIVESIGDAYFETDLTGVFTFINDTVCKDLGYSREELLRMSNRNLQDETSAQETYAVFSEVYETGQPVKEFQYRATRSDGTRAVFEISISLMRDAQGKPIGFRGLSRDITERKKMEEALRDYSEQLEARVKERTAELEKSKVAAEAASRAKSDFMANISHEFQTPLNSVIGFTKVMRDRMFGDLNEKQDEFLGYIADAGTSLSRIITEIIDASQISSGNINLNMAPISLVDVLFKTGKMLAVLMEEKKQVFKMVVDPDADMRIEADEQKMQQVFFHLLSNAFKYTPEGGKINIRAFRTRLESSGQDGINIAFSDTGTGIRQEDIPRLFQAFGTLESPYTRSGAGIGMGLALTKQLVELHGGTIQVESEFGRGSCFTVFLPLKQKQTGSME